eukprot:6490470-Amphidinium_carterae.2
MWGSGAAWGIIQSKSLCGVAARLLQDLENAQNESEQLKEAERHVALQAKSDKIECFLFLSNLRSGETFTELCKPCVDKRARAQIAKRVKATLESCPAPAPENTVQRLLAHSRLNEPTPVVSSALGREVARLRTTYTDSVFLFHSEGEDTVCLKLLMAKILPTTLIWLRLLPVHVSAVEICDRNKVWSGVQSVPPTCLWSYDVSDISVVDPFLAVDIGSVDIFMTSRFAGNALLLTYDDCCPMQTIHTSLRRTLPGRTRVQTGIGAASKRLKRPESSSSSSESSSEQAECVEGESVPVSSEGIQEESEPPLSDDDVDEKRWTEAYAALEIDREAIRVQDMQVDEWFRFDLMGGAWNISRSGKVAYGPRVSAKPNSLAAAFLKTFGVANSASFEHSTYGEQISHKLAALWKEEVTRKALFWHAEGSPPLWPQEKYTSAPHPPECDMDPSLLNARARTRREKILAIPVGR